MTSLPKRAIMTAGILALGVGAAQPASAQDPGLRYRVHIRGAQVTYKGPDHPDHGARTYRFTFRYPAHPRRSGIYKVFVAARSAGVAEVINGAKYRAALKAPRGVRVFTWHGSGMWAVVRQTPGSCTAKAGMYQARNVMVVQVKAPTCKEAKAAATPAFQSVADAIF
jgi:hypothetical protein